MSQNSDTQSDNQNSDTESETITAHMDALRVIEELDSHPATADQMKIMVYRLKPESVDSMMIKGYLETFYLPQTVPGIIEEIGQKYGGGEYQLRVVDAQGRYVKSKKFEISGNPKINGLLAKKPIRGPVLVPLPSKFSALRRLDQPLYSIIKLTPGVYKSHELTFFQYSTKGFSFEQASCNGSLPYPNVYIMKSIGLMFNGGSFKDFEKLLEDAFMQFNLTSPHLEGPAKLFAMSDTNRLYRCFEKLCKNPDTSYQDFADTIGQMFDRNHRGYQLDFPVELMPQQNFNVKLKTNSTAVELKKELSIACIFDGEYRRGLTS